MEWITAALMTIGSIFALMAALGIVRLPDVYMRMHAASKSTTLGVGCILLSVAVHFGELGIASRAVLTIAFLLLTAPVAGHMIARAAYLTGVPQWDGAVVDELEGCYAKHAPPESEPHGPPPDASRSQETA
ncbi:MAG: monovalent cation/H(+) antiporter subunit G [Planctomycetes bacterium]|nr:monovalent cation/H(+) antiporter subunit G [Planctomycetota bacterium]